MSNAMRFGKRSLAGVAAGALALGMLTIASAPAASAAPSIKPKAAVTATVTPVRLTLTGTTVDVVPYAGISWTSSNTLANTDTVVLTLTEAPSGAARLALAPSASRGLTTGFNGTAFSSVGNFAAGGYGLGAAQMNQSVGVVAGETVATAGGTASLGIAVSAAGPYAGTISTFRGGVALDTVSFSFTTRGAPTSMTLTPATQTVSVNGTATMSLTLLGAGGTATQPLIGFDSIVTSSSPAVTGQPSTPTIGTGGALATDLWDGSANITFVPNAAGTYTVTATPRGTLPATGVAAQSAQVSANQTSAFTGSTIAAPTVGVSTSDTIYTEPVAVAAGTSPTIYASTTVKAITFAVSGTAGTTVAYTVTDTTATPAGVTNAASTVAIGADGTGTFTVTAASPSTTSRYTVAIGPPAGAISTYTIQYSPTGALNLGNLTTVPGGGTTSFVKTGEAQAIVATMTDQFGLPLTGISVTATPSISAAVTGTTGSNGNVTLSVAAPATATSQTIAMTAAALGNAAGGTFSALTFIYNASGAPTSLTASSTAGTVAQTAAATQYVDTAGNKTGNWSNSTVTTETQWMQVTATVGGGVSGVPVRFSGEGLYFATTNGTTLANAEAGSEIAATVAGNASILVKATKTGTATVKLEAGTLSTTISWVVANQSTDARVLAVTPAKQDASGRAQVTATVKDAFGNPVGNAGLNFSEVGVGNFASGASTLTTATGPTGIVTVDVISPEPGDSVVTVTASGTANWTATAGTPVTGAPAGVSSGVAAIKFGAARGITITGTRTTVSGKPGIKVEGAVTGIENGKTVIPYFRFPGETTFAQGTARPVIEGGKFTWERKTGKKFYAYVTSDDGQVQSNRVIIAAN